jgi:uncharacterized protein
MTASHPVAFDHLLFAAMCATTIIEARWLYPALLRAIAADVPGARLRGYTANVVVTWMFTASILALWVIDRRPWTGLFLGAVNPLRVGPGFLLSVIYLAVVWWQVRALLAQSDGVDRLRRQFSKAPPFLPRTLAELRGFRLVSLTAGICEEIICRGFLIWYFASLIGFAAAVVASVILFGLAHLYLGRGHALRAGLAGAVLTVIVLATNSLWPAIVLHALVDGVAGELGFRFRTVPSQAG